MDSTRGDHEKIERYRDFFGLQLRFAEAVAEKTSTPIADAVLLTTNLHRRFGLGDAPADDAPGPIWQQYARGLEALATHQQRADWTQTFYAKAPNERSAFPNHVFGCFSFHAGDTTNIVRLHFNNRDALGPLSKARAEMRRHELEDMFAYIRMRFPHAGYVEGRSWLYGTEAYRRLFPEDYVGSRVLIESGDQFQGMSRWGQFLDREGNTKPELKEMFLKNIERLNADRLWETFPLPSFRVSAPIDVFYGYYGIAD
jgi:choline dehydrogenase-like flavoprotein